MSTFSGPSGRARKHPECPKKLRLQFFVDRRKIKHLDYFLWYSFSSCPRYMITCYSCRHNPLRKRVENHRIWISWPKNCFVMCNVCHIFTAWRLYDCTFTIIYYNFYFIHICSIGILFFFKSTASLICRKI